ncbi:hypothetical protein [Geomicrobium sp. JCM 19037]|nr:hypothetical protein [Geomicrobium sp. JCM 19037]
MEKTTYYVNLNPISMDDLAVTHIEDSGLYNLRSKPATQKFKSFAHY